MEHYTRKQEIVNGLIHGIGILFGVSGLPVLIGIATAHGNTPGIIGAGVYGFCFLLLFTNSTIYHFVQEDSLKRIFKIFDHISINFFLCLGQKVIYPRSMAYIRTRSSHLSLCGSSVRDVKNPIILKFAATIIL